MNDLEFVGDYRQPGPNARQRELGFDEPSAGDFTFGDFIDIINPLQHIPIVSTLYRAITGDEISPHARILGGTLFGGPTGFLAAIANVFYEEVAGEDIGETVMALFTGDDTEAEPQFAEGGIRVDDAVMPASAADGTWSESALLAPLETAASPGARADAVLPEAAPGMLTGQDALNALFMDLRGGRQAQESIPLAAEERQAIPLPGRQGAAPAKSYPLPPRNIRVAPAAPEAAADPAAPQSATTVGEAVHPLLFAQEAGEGGIADRMMQALDKYRAMSQQRHQRAKDEDKPAREAYPAVAPASGS
jgi:hypothetical protein